MAGLIIGIDTGGTYTDAVLYDPRSEKILSAVKTPTDREDLPGCVNRALSLLDGDLASVGAVNLSTTLATNAAVEGKLRPTALFLIGYNRDWDGLKTIEASDLAALEVVFVRGGHDYYGNEKQPLDAERLASEMAELRSRVEAVAVSALYGVRNPAHELAAKSAVESVCGLPVVCGHELSNGLNSVLRARTASINAALIPLINDLVKSVRGVMNERGLTKAELHILKGDGSLVRSDSLLLRPVETLLSGPAASVAGAEWLMRISSKGEKQVGYVVDIGGTTTDIARTVGGRVSITDSGATVGRFKTMVKAADISTYGLGGDSAVRVAALSQLTIGPERFEPLVTLFEKYPWLIPSREIADVPPLSLSPFPFYVGARSGAADAHLDGEPQRLLAGIGQEPKAFVDILGGYRTRHLPVAILNDLWKRGLIHYYGFTPTDALAVLGKLEKYEGKSVVWAAEILGRAYGHIAAGAFCELVVERTERALAGYVAAEALRRDGFMLEDDVLADSLVQKLLDGEKSQSLALSMRLGESVVVIGAPAETYSKLISGVTGTDCSVPKLNEVANAVGAAVSSVWLKREVRIAPLPDKNGYRLYSVGEGGLSDFEELDEAVAFAERLVTDRLLLEAEDAGIGNPVVRMSRVEQGIDVMQGSTSLYLATILSFEVWGNES